MNVSKKIKLRVAVLCGVAACLAALGFFRSQSASIPDSFETVAQTPKIFPDYIDVALPYNIAPANFVVQEEGEKYVVAISSENESLVVSGKRAKFPLKAWKRLLEKNKGKDLRVNVYVKTKEGWRGYRPFSEHISDKPIDGWCVYRSIEPGYESFSKLRLAQRNLETFEERPLYNVETTGGSRTCVNCHSFQANKPTSFLFHQRVINPGTIICRDGEFQKVNLSVGKQGGVCAYPAWRPQGDFVAFSSNDTFQIFHEKNPNRIEVMDACSDLYLYNVKSKSLTSIFKTNDVAETFPSWSSDGKWLYYSMAKFKSEAKLGAEERYLSTTAQIGRIRYGIWRVFFDETTQTFGVPELVVDAPSEGASALFARVSPDGNSLIYTRADSGTFPIWRREADLWRFDLKTRENAPLTNVNSPETESYHSWNSTGDWLVFSSRREDGLFTRLYIAQIGKDGTATKPFMLPQRDPEDALRRLKSFNVPEFLTEPVDYSALKEIVKTAKQEARQVK